MGGTHRNKKLKELKTLKSIVSKSCITNDEKCKNCKVVMKKKVQRKILT